MIPYTTNFLAPSTGDPTANARPRVLFAVYEASRPNAALRRALSLSRLLDADLFVLCVLGGQTAVYPLFPELNVVDAVRGVERTLRCQRDARGWVDRVLGEQLPADRLELKVGSFVDEVARHAEELGAGLIVMGPHDGHFGSMVTRLVQLASIPVLVARPSIGGHAIVAGTDMTDDKFPVLRLAATLAAQFDAPLVAVHNDGSSDTSGDWLTWGSSVRSDADVSDAARRLTSACLELGVESEAVVSNEVTAVRALLREARRRDADMVVVGAHRHSWFERLLGGGVAARVVDGASRSVLVTPFAVHTSTVSN